MALLIVLFERKHVLINELKQYNDQFEKNQSYTNEFREKYAWTGI